MLTLTSGEKSSEHIWGAVVRYVNDEPGGTDDYRKLLVSLDFKLLEMVDTGDGLVPRPFFGEAFREVFAIQAEESRGEARRLLLWFCDPARRIQDKDWAAQLLTKHVCIRSYNGTHKNEGVLSVGIDFKSLIDPICDFIGDQLKRDGSTAIIPKISPIGACRHCEKLFIRHKRQTFCSNQCKTRYHNHGSTRADAFYQFKRRSQKLSVGVLQKKQTRIKNGNLAPADKNLRLDFLKSLIKKRLSGVRSVSIPHRDTHNKPR